MAWQKGKPRPAGAGRKKGTPNKSTQDLMEICEQEGIEPFRAMVRLAAKEKDEWKQFDLLKEIAQYLYPKRKAIEHSGKDGGAIEIKELKDSIDDRKTQVTNKK